MPTLAHISTERLEEYYSFGLVSLDIAIEEHLRDCQECRDRLMAVARFAELREADPLRLA